MHANIQSESQRKRRMKLIGASIILFIIIIFLLYYRPRILVFHANISSVPSSLLGDVFKLTDDIYVVRLNNGIQLTIETNPPRAFIFPRTNQKVLRIGSYLILPSSNLYGVDLTHSEGFGRQVPVIIDNKITLGNPGRANSTFSFPK